MTCGTLVLPQPAPPPNPDAAVRQAIDRYLNALRRGDREAVLALARPNATRFSSGGTRLGSMVGLPRGVDGTKISYFVRHVEFLRPDVALAVGLWHDSNFKPPYQSGAFSYTLVQEGGVWKFASVQQTLIPALPAVDGSTQQPPIAREGDWEILFDGKTAEHWPTISGARDLGGSWRVADGCLIAIPESPGADLRSDREYTLYELTWEWMAAKRSNSGVKYRLYGGDVISSGAPRFAAGWEYQMADDSGDPGALIDDRQKSGALYGVVPVSRQAAKQAGEWNSSRLVIAADHVEHWLNGVMTARYPVDAAFESPVSLQHHRSEVRFRNIRIRPLTGK